MLLDAITLHLQIAYCYETVLNGTLLMYMAFDGLLFENY